jgi:hypothetical protein
VILLGAEGRSVAATPPQTPRYLAGAGKAIEKSADQNKGY